MGSSSNCFILSSFFLRVGSCVEEGALAAVSQDGFQSRPVWISFRHLFQGYVAFGSQEDFGSIFLEVGGLL